MLMIFIKSINLFGFVVTNSKEVPMHKFEQGFDDGRSFFRTLVNQPVNITLLDQENNIDVVANCRDISETGIALELEHPVEIGTILQFNFDCDDQVPVPLTYCKGRVLRCEAEGNELYLLAIEVIDTE